MPRITQRSGKRHWIVCLFTSWHYGPQRRNPPEEILENTVTAVNDMKEQLRRLTSSSADVLYGDDVDGNHGRQNIRPGNLWSCRFNAGLFGVPWERTKEILENSGIQVTVATPAI